MIRPPVTLLALFLVPFVAYAAFAWIAKRQGSERRYWRVGTSLTLAIAGLLLMLGNLFYLSQFSGAAPGSTYEPAHTENGRFVPGRAR